MAEFGSQCMDAIMNWMDRNFKSDGNLNQAIMPCLLCVLLLGLRSQSVVAQPPTGFNNAPVSQVGFTTPDSSSAASGVNFEAGELIAVVGPDHILAGEMFPIVDSILLEYQDKVPKAQLEKMRRE